jgi:CRP-like cAMP-binding protein
MHKSESAPTLGAALAVTKHEPAVEQENGSIPSVPRLPIRSLEPLIEYYIGRPEPQTPHEKRVNKLLAENKLKIQRQFELPDWAKITPVYDAAATLHRAMQAREEDTLFPHWVKARKDFQAVFDRFNGKITDINIRVRVPIRKHTEERSKSDVKVILEWVQQFPQLEHLNEDRLMIVCGKIKHRDLKMGQNLFQEGDTESIYYIVVQGSLALTKRGMECPSNILKAGDTFGEEALELASTTAPREETCTALENHTCVAMLRGYTYRESMTNFESQRTNSNRDFLESHVPLVSGWSWQRLLQLAAMLEVERFPEGSTISKQGEPVNKMYFIRAGSVSINREIGYTRTNKWPTSRSTFEEMVVPVTHNVQVDECYKGDYCCEEGLFGMEKRECTVIARSPVELLSFSKEDAMFIITRQAKKVIKQRANVRFKSSGDVANDFLLKKRRTNEAKRAKRMSYGVRYLLRKSEGDAKILEKRRQKKWKDKIMRLLQEKALAKSMGSPNKARSGSVGSETTQLSTATSDKMAASQSLPVLPSV